MFSSSPLEPIQKRILETKWSKFVKGEPLTKLMSLFQILLTGNPGFKAIKMKLSALELHHQEPQHYPHCSVESHPFLRARNRHPHPTATAGAPPSTTTTQPPIYYSIKPTLQSSLLPSFWFHCQRKKNKMAPPLKVAENRCHLHHEPAPVVLNHHVAPP